MATLEELRSAAQVLNRRTSGGDKSSQPIGLAVTAVLAALLSIPVYSALCGALGPHMDLKPPLIQVVVRILSVLVVAAPLSRLLIRPTADGKNTKKAAAVSEAILAEAERFIDQAMAKGWGAPVIKLTLAENRAATAMLFEEFAVVTMTESHNAYFVPRHGFTLMEIPTNIRRDAPYSIKVELLHRANQKAEIPGTHLQTLLDWMKSSSSQGEEERPRLGS